MIAKGTGFGTRPAGLALNTTATEGEGNFRCSNNLDSVAGENPRELTVYALLDSLQRYWCVRINFYPAGVDTVAEG